MKGLTVQAEGHHRDLASGTSAAYIVWRGGDIWVEVTIENEKLVVVGHRRNGGDDGQIIGTIDTLGNIKTGGE